VLRFRAVAAFAALWLAACGQSSTPPSLAPAGLAQSRATLAQTHPDTNVNELPEPPVVSARNGVAKVALTAAVNPATGLPTFVYEGMPGVIPTIRVAAGDTIVVDVTNDLLPTHNMADDMNLHFHGLGVSPRAPSDDVLGMLAQPGQSLHYVVHVGKTQQPGLYWYHPHVHGETSFQVGESGMSGALVVEGLTRHLPGLAKMHERIIIVRDTGIGPNGIRRGNPDGMDGMGGARALPQTLNNDPCGPELGLTASLNGAVNPVITIAPGEKQFFRVVNAAGHKTLKLAVDGEMLEVVAIDGFALDTYPGTPPTLREASIVMPPASRAEFVVTGPRSGFAKFRTLCYDSGPVGDRDPEIDLARLVAPHRKANGDAVAMGPLTVGAPLPRNEYTTALPPVAARRTVVFSESATHFLINGKTFSISDPPMFVVHTGTVEEWHVINITREIHDFHIHQIHFLVKEINGVKVAHPFWADSTVIPHRRSDGSNGSLVLLMDFRNPAIKGVFVFHCHILDHEDHGMMAKIQAI
jgi:suppressor of ftsI